jgi:hypothetical protein
MTEIPWRVSITRDDFFDADDLPLTEVPLPAEFYGEGAVLFVRTMDGRERSAWEKRWMDEQVKEDPGGFRWDLLQKTVVDADGRPFFAAEDEALLMGTADKAGKSAKTIELLFDASRELNGLSESDVKALEKNSDAGQ